MDGVESIISELEKQRGAIDRALAALREIGGVAGRNAAAPAKRRGRRLGSKKHHKSAVVGGDARSEGQKRRWAEQRASEGSQRKAGAARKKTGLTAAGRKRLSEAMKARWASKNPPIKKLAAKSGDRAQGAAE